VKRISQEELKEIQMNILKDVHFFCVSNHIRYTLAYGTLLGAIRHKGFIPWDDDIDIAMPRKDYDHFITLYRERKNYKVYTSLDSGYYYTYAKIADVRTCVDENVSMKKIGVNVDLFPVDNLFDDIDYCKKFYAKCALWKKIYRIKLLKPSYKNVWWKRIAIIFLKWMCFRIPFSVVCSKIEAAHANLNNDKSLYVGVTVGNSSSRAIVERSIYADYKMVEFEHEMFYAVKKYHEYLTHEYGDCMTPPKNKQSPHTLNNVYWL